MTAAKGINEKSFEPKPNAAGYCRWCDYLQICPVFQNGAKFRFPTSNVSALVEEIDRYGKLQAHLTQMQEEKVRLESKLRTHLLNNNKPSIKGHHFAVSIGSDEKLIVKGVEE